MCKCVKVRCGGGRKNGTTKIMIETEESELGSLVIKGTLGIRLFACPGSFCSHLHLATSVSLGSFIA